MGNLINEKGNKYGRLLVIDFSHNKPGRGAFWNCICDCGTLTKVLGSNLRSGTTKSCGCLHIEKVSKHGYSKHRLYNFYNHAKNRCINPNDDGYPQYGGRGIKFLFSSIEEFIETMGPTYKEGLSLDRKDVNGNYEVSNCRWVTMEQQANNKQNTIYVTINNTKVTLKDASTIFDIPYKSLWKRYNKYGDNFIELSKPKKI